VPAPYEGRPWFLPVVGEYFRMKDRRARGGAGSPAWSPTATSAARSVDGGSSEEPEAGAS
jgi:hypothetical protein